MATWRQIQAEIEQIVTADCESGECDWRDDDAADEYAWQYADCSHYVIYHYASREAWLTGADEWEDEASDLGPFDSIQAWITATVFCAIRATVMDAISDYRTEHEEDEDDD